MLNPSTADHKLDDPTIRRCTSYAKSWGFGSLEVVNLFAYKTSSPKELFAAKEPVGEQNDQYILKSAAKADRIIVAWGNLRELSSRTGKVLQLLSTYRNKIKVLRISLLGAPCHPLYLPSDLKPRGLNQIDTNNYTFTIRC